jgi:mannose-6-phosphate isomerase-like protein (cupin superfamily)
MSVTSSDRRIYSPLQRDAASFLETAAESGGRRSLLEIELAVGGGNAPHRHLSYDERFEVVSGTLTVLLGDREVRLAPGESATAPIGAVHCFRNDTDAPVVFRVELSPGHRGFEKALQVAYALHAEGRVLKDGTPRNPLVLGLLLEWSDIGMVGPKARVIGPIAGVLAAIARRRGIDRELEERYVRY